MAEFPAKVSTQTSTPEASSHGGIAFFRPDISFLKSIPGILMLVEIVLGLLVWALIAGSNYWPVYRPAYGWVIFVAVFCWVITLILFILFLFNLQRRIGFVPWPLTMFIYNAAACLLYVTAFITCAASITAGPTTQDAYDKRAAASFFACLVMIAYGASTFFSFTLWRGPGANAASAQA